MLLWLSSVCSTPKWDILATDVAVYFDSKLRKLKLQTYQSVGPAKNREKLPGNAENRKSGVWREEKYPSLVENAAEMKSGPHLAISISRMTKTPAGFMCYF